MESSPPRMPTNAQVLLGLFIVWQLLFLGAANGAKLLDQFRSDLKGDPCVEAVALGWTAKKGHVYDAEEVITGLTARWAQLTGQPQNWGLFSPNVASYIPFIAVEFRWDDDPCPAAAVAPLATDDPLAAITLTAAASGTAHPPVLLLSDNEPQDVRRFFRVGKFRLRKYESNLDVTLVPRGVEGKPDLDSWREKIESKVRREWDAIQGYLRWRQQALQRECPELPRPRQIVLLVRQYRIPPPYDQPEPWLWQDNQVRRRQPVARWRPVLDPPAGYLPIEMYNPIVGRFEYVR